MSKSTLDENNTGYIHPEVANLKEQLDKGTVDRREFIRTVTFLGLSASAAYAMAGLDFVPELDT